MPTPISLPRLGLCGAVWFMEKCPVLLPQLFVDRHESVYLTDSTIVLIWLSKPPWTAWMATNYLMFVLNLTLLIWLSEVLIHATWWPIIWHGPEWVHLPHSQWPARIVSVHEQMKLLRSLKWNLSNLPPKWIVSLNSEEHLDSPEHPKLNRVLLYIHALSIPRRITVCEASNLYVTQVAMGSCDHVDVWKL